MTIAELKKMTAKEKDALFLNMPEPSYQKAINTEVDSLDQIIRDFAKSKISKKDRKALQNDLMNFA